MRCFTAGVESAIKSCRKPLKRFLEWGRWKEVGGDMMLASVYVCVELLLRQLSAAHRFEGAAFLL